MSAELVALTQVVLIDLVLAGDNAIVVGMAAAGVERAQRLKVVFWGVSAAVILRVAFSLVAVQLLAVVGLTLAGGLLLLWVCVKLFRETRTAAAHHAKHKHHDGDSDDSNTEVDDTDAPRKSMRTAIGQIVVADISMSLDNVLAVAGAAREHSTALVIGLLLSVALMGVAATVIAPMFKRWPWIAYIGLAVIFYVAVEMIWTGSHELVVLAQSRL
ncbi:MAG: YjbE family putative metal transport protein [Rhodospirillaceae bacterium]